MWIIVDKDNVIRDISSDRRNLSDVHRSEGSRDIDIGRPAVSVQIEDSYVDGKVIPNVRKRRQREINGLKHRMIEISVWLDKATALGFSEIAAEYQTRFDALHNRLINLENLQDNEN